MKTRGFTVVELIITITIMGILLTLAVVSLNASQLQARDDERQTDVQAIQTGLESIYKAGVPVTSSIPTVTNLVDNPSVTSNTTNWVTASPFSGARVQAGGDWVYQITRTTSGTGTLRIGGTTALAVVSGLVYTASATVTSSVSGTFSFKIASGTAGSDLYTTAYSLSAGVPVRISLSGQLNTSTVNLAISSSSGSNGDTLTIDKVMLTAGSSLYNYNDGNSSGWKWSGTTDNSSSSGPSVTSVNGPGAYPTTAFAASGSLTVYLPDVDQKIFLTPGQTSTDNTFLAATNSTQTAVGVTPQPTIDHYIYQPIDSGNGLCEGSEECRKYNLYFRLEGDNTVYKVSSKNQ